MHDVALHLDATVTTMAGRVHAAGPSLVTVHSAAVRPMGALMLRGGAGRGAGAVSELASMPRAGRVVSGRRRKPGRVDRATCRPGRCGRCSALRPRAARPSPHPQGTLLATWVERAAQVTVVDLRAQLTALVDAPGALALAGTPPRDVLAVRREDLMLRLDPGRTVIDTMRARLNLGLLTFDVFADALIRPIMAAPRFDRPMYQALDSYDREWLVPGLGNLPEPELVTLLSTNDEFTEAFLVGLSDEMGRELLWRSYPTDARGTYFYRFWDPTKDELSQQIHRFTPTQLGSHVTHRPARPIRARGRRDPRRGRPALPRLDGDGAAGAGA